MSTTEAKRRSDDSAIDTYLDSHNVYASADLCIDIAAVIQYARDHHIPLTAVPAEIIEKYTKKSAQKVS